MMNTQLNQETKEDQLTLNILDAIERQSDLSQRRLAGDLGIALGLTNSYLKRCIRKGLVKVSAIPSNRYLYYLTPKGFSEKTRLTAEFLSVSFSFYRQAGDSCQRIFKECENQGIEDLLFCGRSELAEIAFLKAMEFSINIVGIYVAESSNLAPFYTKPVWSEFDQVNNHQGLLITDLNDPENLYRDLSEISAEETIFFPDILRIKSQSSIV
ncbi:MAG: winged helix-turn-helix transcriptional regulator [Arenicellales bacterium]|jgi:DNA-binding MarR family transcriptional regulator|nr:winged helix-turn-helix transcriptional regulator [Arenicellales bacterium]|tara:strand:- start:4172 stop:4807 length:636 start_codon:yes stop_codon:yes gene_type:complete